MEVLTGVDRDRIAALRARDEFFWLALEDAREFSQRASARRRPSCSPRPWGSCCRR